MDTNKITKIILGTIFSACIIVMCWSTFAQIARAVTYYPPGALLQPNDVTSSHIRQGTIINEDVSNSAGIQSQKIKDGSDQGLIYMSNGTGLATSSNFKISTSTPDLYVFGGRMHASSTNFNGVNQTWPSADGTASQVLTTNGANTLSWTSPTATLLSTTLTTDEALITGTAVGIATGTQSIVLVRSGIQYSGAAGFGDAAATTKRAMSFTETTEIIASQLCVALSKTGTPVDNTVLTLETDNVNKPSGTVLGTITIANSSLSTSIVQYTNSFATTTFAANTKYWIVFSRSGAVDGVNYPRVAGQGSVNEYPNGNGSQYDGATWTDVPLADWKFDLFTLSTPGRAFRTSGSMADFAPDFVGFSTGSYATGTTATISVAGTQTGLSGLTAGLNYYASNATGTISTIPGTFVKKVCKALSATSCLISSGW